MFDRVCLLSFTDRFSVVLLPQVRHFKKLGV